MDHSHYFRSRLDGHGIYESLAINSRPLLARGTSRGMREVWLVRLRARRIMTLGQCHFICGLECPVSSCCIIDFSLLWLYCRVRANETRLARFDTTRTSSASQLLLTKSTRRQALYYIGTFVLRHATIYANWMLPSVISLTNSKAKRINGFA